MTDSGRDTGPSASHRDRRRDGGFTFVETVLTVVLMGIVVVPVLAAVRGAIRVSTVSESAAEIETILVNAADRVQRAPHATSCDFTPYAQAAAVTAGWPADRVSVVQEYLDVETSTWTSGAPGSEACPPGPQQERLAKRVTIIATTSNGSLSRSIQVVKSDV